MGRKGFRTCFTKFDPSGAVTARGCSTKDKIFHIECENHVMGRTSEKFCYCSYFLCNGGSSDRLGFVIWANLFLAVIVNKVCSVMAPANEKPVPALPASPSSHPLA